MSSRQSILRFLENMMADAGFQRRDRIFLREANDQLLQIIGYEAGRGSAGGLFRLNLGLFIPYAEYARAGRTIARPTDHDCHVRVPLHSLAGIKRWGIPVDEDEEKLKKWLEQSIKNFALPFFSKHVTFAALLETDWAHVAPRTFELDRISRAALLMLMGDEDSAAAALREEYVSRAHSPGGSADIVIAAAERLEISDFASL
jgi:Domain of unknown function (DUF4304)